MTAQVMRGLLQTRLLTLGWASQTVFEGRGFTPAPGTPYQLVNTIFAEPEALTVAGSSMQEGIFQVRLMYPLAEVAKDGIGVPWARAEQIAALFPRNLLLTSGGVKVKIAREAQIIRAEPQGDRDVTIVRVRFRDR